MAERKTERKSHSTSPLFRQPWRRRRPEKEKEKKKKIREGRREITRAREYHLAYLEGLIWRQGDAGDAFQEESCLALLVQTRDA